MTKSKLKELIGFEQLTKEDILAKLIALADRLDGWPSHLQPLQGQITRGEAFAIALLVPLEQQWKLVMDDATIAEVQALKQKIGDRRELQKAAALLLS